MDHLVVSKDAPHTILAISSPHTILGYRPRELEGRRLQVLEGQLTDIPVLLGLVTAAKKVDCSARELVFLYDKYGLGNQFLVSSKLCQSDDFSIDAVLMTIEAVPAFVSRTEICQDCSRAWAILSAQWPYLVECISPLFTELLGHTGPEIIGQSLSSIKPPSTPSAPWLTLLRSAAAGQAAHNVVEAQSMSGRKFLVEVTCIPVAEDLAEPASGIAVLVAKTHGGSILLPPRRDAGESHHAWPAATAAAANPMVRRDSEGVFHGSTTATLTMMTVAANAPVAPSSQEGLWGVCTGGEASDGQHSAGTCSSSTSIFESWAGARISGDNLSDHFSKPAQATAGQAVGARGVDIRNHISIHGALSAAAIAAAVGVSGQRKGCGAAAAGRTVLVDDAYIRRVRRRHQAARRRASAAASVTATLSATAVPAPSSESPQHPATQNAAPGALDSSWDGKGSRGREEGRAHGASAWGGMGAAASARWWDMAWAAPSPADGALPAAEAASTSPPLSTIGGTASAPPSSGVLGCCAPTYVGDGDFGRQAASVRLANQASATFLDGDSDMKWDGNDHRAVILGSGGDESFAGGTEVWEEPDQEAPEADVGAEPESEFHERFSEYASGVSNLLLPLEVWGRSRRPAYELWPGLPDSDENGST